LIYKDEWYEFLFYYFTSDKFTVRESSRGLILEKYFINTGSNDPSSFYDSFPELPFNVVLELEVTQKSLRLTNVYSFTDIIEGVK
jgi:hypothetical protein